MRYFVKVRHRTFDDDVENDTITRGDLVADVYRIEWFGFKRTLIRKGISAAQTDYEAAIKHDMLKERPTYYDFESDEYKDTDKRRIWH